MRLVFDIETDGLLPDVTKVHCIVLKDLDTNEVITPKIKKAMQLLGEAELIIGHNIIKYDIPVLQKLYGFYTEAKIFDTIVAARLMYPDIKERDFRKKDYPKKLIGRHSLEAWVIVLVITNHKSLLIGKSLLKRCWTIAFKMWKLLQHSTIFLHNQFRLMHYN